MLALNTTKCEDDVNFVLQIEIFLLKISSNTHQNDYYCFLFQYACRSGLCCGFRFDSRKVLGFKSTEDNIGTTHFLRENFRRRDEVFSNSHNLNVSIRVLMIQIFLSNLFLLTSFKKLDSIRYLYQ